MGWPAALAPSNSLMASAASRLDSYVTKAVPSERPARSYLISRLMSGPMREKRPCGGGRGLAECVWNERRGGQNYTSRSSWVSS
jgi:hypothetical protein